MSKRKLNALLEAQQTFRKTRDDSYCSACDARLAQFGVAKRA
jgi:hypothetical protein